MMDVDVNFYRDAVLEIILSGKHFPREVCELRYSLFLRAANFYFAQTNKNSEVCEPFPHCFFDFPSKTRRYDELKDCIANIPALSEITDLTSLPESTWELLHWMFTNPLNIEVVKKSETSAYFTDELRKKTKLMSIPYPSNICNRFDITHQMDINSKNEFRRLISEFGSFYAYHGSPGHNFHSIIHRGLRCSLNVRKAYGPGTYLTSYLDTATSYATQYGYRGGSSVPFTISHYSSSSRIRYCVAIAEVIKHPSVKIVNFGSVPEVMSSISSTSNAKPPNFDDTSSKHHKYYVVNSDNLIRLKHLLVFY